MTSSKYRLILTFIGLVGLSAPATAAMCKTASEREVLGLFTQWNDSLKSGDPHQVASLYQDDALLLPTVSGIPRQTREARIDYFEHFWPSAPAANSTPITYAKAATRRPWPVCIPLILPPAANKWRHVTPSPIAGTANAG